MKFRKNAERILAFLVAFTMLFSCLLYAEEKSILNESSQQMGPDTYYKNASWITENGIFNINTVETNIGAEFIKIEVSDNGKAIGTSTVSKQAEQKYGKDTRVIGAINGDFFHTNGLRGLPIGTTIIDGEIRTALPESTVFGITDKGDCFIEDLKMDSKAQIGKKVYPIAGINSQRWTDYLILFTPAIGSSTNTNGMGIEIVVKELELPILVNGTYKGVVTQVLKETEAAEIPEDGVVLSGHGLAARFLDSLEVGDKISFSIGFDREDVKFAVSGTPRIIEKGQIVTDMKGVGQPLARHPRTAIGIKGDKVMMVTVDGRQKGFSDGMTLYELGEYMIGQGVEDAINFDGGGSTAMIVRKQGDVSPKLVNSPSDGRERPVANSIQIISDAPVSEPKVVKFMKDSIKIFMNSSYTPSAYALDRYFNRVDVEANKLKYTVSKGIGSIDENGLFISSQKAGTGYIEALLGESKNRIDVQVFDKVASLRILNDYISLEPGEKVQMSVKAFDETGEQIIIDPSAVKWIVSGGIGTVDKLGVFTAGNNLIEGKIIAKVDTVTADVPARVGNLPIVLEGFEKEDNIEIKSIRAEAHSRLSDEKEPVRLGSSALKLEYNMKTDEVGTSAAYVTFKEAIKVPGKPIEIGLWVYGNAPGNWLRGTYINGNGERKVVNYTAQGGFNWNGWKYVYAEIPKDEKFPIAIEQIYIAEPMEENKSKGAVYLDNLYALYKAGEDYYSPEVVEVNIANKAELTEKPEEIVIKVRDKGEGIDPKSIVLLLDNIQVKADYDPATNTIRHKIVDKLYKGEHEIRLRLSDKAGNRMNPELRTSFIIVE
ncbi:MAG: phosphodiester glycosidase family protein [Christensenellales bacterium]|jgi:hypothetical protein